MARDKINDSGQCHVLLETTLKVERHRFKRTLLIAVLRNAKSAREQELVDAQRAPLNDMNKFVEMNSLG